MLENFHEAVLGSGRNPFVERHHIVFAVLQHAKDNPGRLGIRGDDLNTLTQFLEHIQNGSLAPEKIQVYLQDTVLAGESFNELRRFLTEIIAKNMSFKEVEECFQKRRWT